MWHAIARTNKNIEDELAYYKENNIKLQCENDKEKYFKGLINKDNSYLKGCISGFII